MPDMTHAADTTETNFAESLKNFMRTKGVTALAERAGVDRVTLWRLANRNMRPKLGMAVDIAAACRTTLAKMCQ